MSYLGYDVMVIPPPVDGVLTKTNHVWREGPMIVVDGDTKPNRIYMMRNGRTRDITNWLQRLAERKLNGV